MKRKSNHVIEILLSEFRALRDEIGSRVRTQQALVTINITGLATILGVAISSPEWWKPYLILVIPFFSCLLGLFYLHEGFVIATMGDYINNKIGQRLRKLTKDEELMEWESWLRKIIRGRLTVAIALGFALPAFFLLPSFIALASTFFPSEGILHILLWIVGAFLFVLTLYLWIYVAKYWEKVGQSSDQDSNEKNSRMGS